MFRYNEPQGPSIRFIQTTGNYDAFDRTPHSIKIIYALPTLPERSFYDEDDRHKEYKEIISVTNTLESTSRSSTALAEHFETTYCQYLLNLLVSERILEHKKMEFYKDNLPKIPNNQLNRYMNKILTACGQETNLHSKFLYVTSTDHVRDIAKISYRGLPISFKQPSPDEYKAYASSCNFFARKHKIDEGSGFILSLPLLNMICSYLAYYNEIISAITPGFCNLQPGFLLTWNNHHSNNKNKEETEKSSSDLRLRS